MIALRTVHVTPPAAERIDRLGLQAEMRRMIEYAQHSLPEITRIQVVLYDRDELDEEPGLAIEVFTPFQSFDAAGSTREKISEWLVSQFSPQVLEHLTIDYLPEAPDAG